MIVFGFTLLAVDMVTGFQTMKARMPNDIKQLEEMSNDIKQMQESSLQLVKRFEEITRKLEVEAETQREYNEWLRKQLEEYEEEKP